MSIYGTSAKIIDICFCTHRVTLLGRSGGAGRLIPVFTADVTLTENVLRCCCFRAVDGEFGETPVKGGVTIRLVLTERWLDSLVKDIVGCCGLEGNCQKKRIDQKF